jgi:hypothetical protein
MENRSFDQFLGHLALNDSRINGVNTSVSNPLNPTDPTSKKVYVAFDGGEDARGRRRCGWQTAEGAAAAGCLHSAASLTLPPHAPTQSTGGLSTRSTTLTRSPGRCLAPRWPPTRPPRSR